MPQHASTYPSHMTIIKQRIRSLARRVRTLVRGDTSPPQAVLDQEKHLLENNYITPDELKKLKTSSQTSSILLGKPIAITDSFWHLHSLKEIFADEVYRFQTEVTNPYILDCGSNIGLSVIYFKRLFPTSKIVAFEPDTHICSLLQHNLQAFHINDVVVENKAIWTHDSLLTFTAAGSLGGRLSDDANKDPSHLDTITVPTVSLTPYLAREVDFLKMDIEGPEVKVLESCAHLLHNVKRLFVEYHSDPLKEQELDHLLLILKNAGFRVYIKEAWNNLPLPFLRSSYKPCYDLQLNIFAYRT